MPVIDTEGLNDNACATLDDWVGAGRSWGIAAHIPDTKCLNLYHSGACEEAHHLSGSGPEGDMRYDGTIRGGFALAPDGLLSGEVPNASNKIVYPETIQLR